MFCFRSNIPPSAVPAPLPPTNIGRFAAVFFTLLVGAGVRHFETLGVPVAMAASAFVIGILLLPFGVETKGQPLPTWRTLAVILSCFISRYCAKSRSVDIQRVTASRFATTPFTGRRT